jgi:hypothetical protein
MESLSPPLQLVAGHVLLHDQRRKVLAVANTAVGIATLLAPICLAVIVLLVIEMTDRIPFPKAGASSTTRPPTFRKREREEPSDLVPSSPTRGDPGRIQALRARWRRIK